MELGQRIIRDHVELRAQLDRVRSLKDGLSIQNELRSLSKALAEHFAREEEGGYLAFVIERSPWLAVRVQILGSQHAEIRATLVGLIEVASDPDRFAHLTEGLQRFFDRLHAHERAETEIIQECLYEDLAGAD